MPQAVTHLLVPLIIGSLIKDWYEKKKGAKSFSLRYVLIAGIGGILPDIDIAVFWVLYFFGFNLEAIHRTFTHTLFLPFIFLILFFVFSNIKTKTIGKHNLRWSLIFLMLSLGIFIHLLLDAVISGSIIPFYPIFFWKIGLNLAGKLPPILENLFAPTLDGGLLVLWIIYLEWKHKISDFI